jgi:hypothetical protein
MSILTVWDALQGIHRSVAGIRKASEVMPAKLNTDDLPFAHMRIDSGEWERVSDFSLQFRTYLVTVFVKPVAQGRPVDDGLKVSARLLQALGEEYLSDITLGGAVQHMGTGARWDPPTMEDSGVQVYTYAGTDYWGFEYRITVKEQIT